MKGAAPKLLKLTSMIIRCGGCKTWVLRQPWYLGDDIGFWQCDKCGSTSSIISEGRPYGPRSKKWAQLVEEFNELWEYCQPYDLDGIVSDPPVPVYDWGKQEERET